MKLDFQFLAVERTFLTVKKSSNAYKYFNSIFMMIQSLFSHYFCTFFKAISFSFIIIIKPEPKSD